MTACSTISIVSIKCMSIGDRAARRVCQRAQYRSSGPQSRRHPFTRVVSRNTRSGGFSSPTPAVSFKTQSQGYIEMMPSKVLDMVTFVPYPLSNSYHYAMRSITFTSVLLVTFVASTHADCRHPNGNIQTDAYHAPRSKVPGNPLNTMCCAIDRPNPSVCPTT